MFTAFHDAQRRLETLAFNLLLEACGLVLAQRDYDLTDRVALGELAQRMNENRSALQFEELFTFAFGTAGRGGHAGSQPRSRNDDYNFHIGEPSINGRSD